MFHLCQSQGGYRTTEDFLKVARGYRDNHIPIDMIYMDIDYREEYKEFTLNKEFTDFPAFVDNMKKASQKSVRSAADTISTLDDMNDKIKNIWVFNNFFCLFTEWIG